MGCFLSCFRSTSRDRPGDLVDPLVVESRLGDAFLDDGKNRDEGGRLHKDAGSGGGVDEELVREANYLKLCGTITQTPPEMLKVSSPVHLEDTNEKDGIYDKAPVMSGDMLLEGTSCEVFDSEKHDASSHQENIIEDYNENDTFSIAQTVSEAMASEGNSAELISSDGHDISGIEEGISKSKEHLLDAESNIVSHLQDKPSCKKPANKMTDSSDSPLPTPLVLRGDIDTPGTVYTALTSKAGKRARPSRQFIYPVLRPIENKMQWMEVKFESPVLSANPPKRRYLSPDSSENPHEISPCSVAKATEISRSASSLTHDKCVSQSEVIPPEESKSQNDNQQLLEDGELFEQNSEYGKNGVSSLSYWLKPSSDTEVRIENETSCEKDIFDVPILSTFGLNWDNENPTPVLPKAWDGNGIPNTTTKYKEDKVVSWHTTPFEQRLLKVLSSEIPHTEREISGKLIQLEENTSTE